MFNDRLKNESKYANSKDNYVFIRADADTQINGFLFDEVINQCLFEKMPERVGLNISELLTLPYNVFDYLRKRVKEYNTSDRAVHDSVTKEFQKAMEGVPKK